METNLSSLTLSKPQQIPDDASIKKTLNPKLMYNTAKKTTKPCQDNTRKMSWSRAHHTKKKSLRTDVVHARAYVTHLEHNTRDTA